MTINYNKQNKTKEKLGYGHIIICKFALFALSITEERPQINSCRVLNNSTLYKKDLNGNHNRTRVYTDTLAHSLGQHNHLSISRHVTLNRLVYTALYYCPVNYICFRSFQGPFFCSIGASNTADWPIVIISGVGKKKLVSIRHSKKKYSDPKKKKCFIASLEYHSTYVSYLQHSAFKLFFITFFIPNI